MERIILYGYEMLTVMLPALISMLLFRLVHIKNGITEKDSYAATILVFSLYIFTLLHVTGTGTIYNVKQYGLEIKPEQINTIPFSDPGFDVVSYGLNVVLFLPLGFLLPFIWESMRSFIPTVAIGAGLSLLVEASQLLNNRRTDIDDFILNTVGTIVGFILYELFFAKGSGAEVSSKPLKWEPIIYIVVMFTCRFLFFNEFGAAKHLYGF